MQTLIIETTVTAKVLFCLCLIFVYLSYIIWLELILISNFTAMPRFVH